MTTRAKVGPLQVHISGGEDRQGSGEGAAILLCHGFGAPGDDLVSLARVIEAGPAVRWFFPEAPLELDLGFGVTGRAWWHIDMVRLQRLLLRGRLSELINETPQGLAEARQALEECIKAMIANHGVVRERLVVGGFSQGGMLATEVALHAEQPFAGLVVMSGTLLSVDRWRVAATRSGRTLHALISHGRADPLVPFQGGEALCTLLRDAGADVTWVPHNGQHEIPHVAIEHVSAFARRRLGQ